MKKVLVLVGSPHRRGATLTAARKFVDGLESWGDVTGEIVVLSDYKIGVCRGCKVCFDRGEQLCPLSDDRDVLIGKMMESDGIVFASPNYSFNVSAEMKIFLDRLGYLFHRPRFHGKTGSAIVVQGFYRGRQIRKYLEFVAGGLGMNVVKGSVISTLEPMTDEAIAKMDKKLAEQSRRFHDRLMRPAYPVPSLFALMMFRLSRTAIAKNVPADRPDHVYYREQGWFDSDYYYPTRLGPFKRAAGALLDWAFARDSAIQVAREPGSTAAPSA